MAPDLRRGRKPFPPIRSTLKAMSVALLMVLSLLHPEASAADTAAPAQTQAQDDRGTEPAATTEPESDSEEKPEGPRREPRFLPPILRPKQLTPEELQEAERLRKLAAKYGTDPTAIVGRVQLSSQYADLPHGARLSDTVARVDIPFRGNWLLRVDAPVHRWLDPNIPGMSSAQGLGNVSAVLGWRAYNTPEYAFLIGAASSFPTASDAFWELESIRLAQSSPRADFFLNGSPSCSECSNTQCRPAAILLERTSHSLMPQFRSIRYGPSVGGAPCREYGRSIGNGKRKAA
jgi:hypothetical protein